jgi:hypothetical protein
MATREAEARQHLLGYPLRYMDAYRATSPIYPGRPERRRLDGSRTRRAAKGTVYHAGCFVVVSRSAIGALTCLVHGPGGWWGVERWARHAKSDTGTARHSFAFYDPKGVLEEEAKARAEAKGKT